MLQVGYAPTILVIDDDPFARRPAQGAAPSECYVLCAADGLMGLDVARSALAQGQLDLVILDIVLPHLEGRHVCALLRQASPTVPILPVTVRRDVDAFLRAFGCLPALHKPVEPATLQSRMRAALAPPVSCFPVADPLCAYAIEHAEGAERAARADSSVLSVIVCALSPFLRLTLTHLVHLVRPDATIIEAATAADLQGLDGDGATRVVIIAAAEYDAFQHVLLTLPAPVIALALTPTERRRLTDRYRHGQLVYAPSALLLSRWFEHALHTAAETARGPKRALPPFDVLFPDGIPLLEPLSPQEVRLALFDMFGCSAKEIALALGVSEASVQGYWKRIGAKLALDRATIRTWVQTRLVPGHASAAATPFVR